MVWATLTVPKVMTPLAPIIQFLIGVFVLQEDMPFARWMGFAIVWVALIVLTIDMFLAGRAGRAGRRVVIQPA